MPVLGVHPPDPSSPKGMAFVLAAGFPDPRPGGHANQQLVLTQGWEAWSEQAYAMGLRFHPELATKWVKGGGQFTCGELLDEKPEDMTIEKGIEEVLDMLAEKQPEYVETIRRLRDTGSPEQKAAALKKFGEDVQTVAKLADYIKGSNQ